MGRTTPIDPASAIGTPRRHRWASSQHMVVEEVTASGEAVSAPGDLIVRRGVHPGAEVRCGGNLVVQGHFEGAVLHCDGACMLAAGASGRPRCLVDVEGDLRAACLEGVDGRIRGACDVEGELLNCTLAVGGGLHGHGLEVIGGRVAVTGSVELTSLGSPDAAPTTLVLGGVPMLSPRLMRFERLLEVVEPAWDLLHQRRHAIILAGRHMTDLDHDLLTEINFHLADLDDRRDGLHRGLTEILERMARRRMVNLSVHGTIHPGVRLRIGPFEACFDAPLTGPLRIDWTDDHVVRVRHFSGSLRTLHEVARLTRMPRA